MGTTFASNYLHLISIFPFVMFQTPYWENTSPHKKKILHPPSIWRLIYQLVFKPLLGKISRSFKSLAGKGVSSPLASSIFACKSCLHSLFKTSRIVLIPPWCESNLRSNMVGKQFAAINECLCRLKRSFFSFVALKLWTRSNLWSKIKHFSSITISTNLIFI